MSGQEQVYVQKPEGNYEGSEAINAYICEQITDLLKAGKLVGLLGGDHSVTYGYLKALSSTYQSFGVLQIDAHCDLRKVITTL